MRLALVLASVILAAAPPAAAGPFGPNRSEGAPPTKKKAKPAKKAKSKSADKAELVETARTAKRTKVAKPVADEDVVVVDDETDDEPILTKPSKRAKSGKAKPDNKPAVATRAEQGDDEITITIDDEEKPAKAIAKKKAKAASIDDAQVPTGDDELESDDDAKAKTTASLDDDGEPLDDLEPSVTKAAAPNVRHKTRFYFRLGLLKQSSKLGGTEFSLQTDLPIDTSSLGAGDSGVEMQQANFPVAMIVGYVLPVLNRKLSLETIIGLPTKTKFKATGALANESLAPTFMGLPTGIEPLGEDIGEATFAPPMLTAVYRIAELGPVTPFAGTGIMLLMARGAKITNPALNEAGDPKLSFSPSPGLVLQGGAEMRIWKRVSARLDVKYVLGMKVNAKIENIAVTPKAIPALGSIEVGDAVMSAKITPLVVQLGIGADF